jgi:hypothetical protein
LPSRKKLVKLQATTLKKVSACGETALSSLYYDFFLLDPNAFIDVWWLIEDGGLVLLLAYLMSRHRDFKREKTRLRLFGLISLSSTQDDITAERERLETLLHRFRFEAEITLVQSDTTPRDEDLTIFGDLLGEDGFSYEMDPETKAVVNLRAHIRRYSSSSRVVFVSMPVPQRRLSDRMYMTYLDMLSDNGRPTFLVRGNQKTVLSIHS